MEELEADFYETIGDAHAWAAKATRTAQEDAPDYEAVIVAAAIASAYAAIAQAYAIRMTVSDKP